MPNHRRVPIGGFAADPLWSVLMQRPALPATDLIKPVSVSKPGKLLWWCAGYPGLDDSDRPMDGTGVSCEARLVYQHATEFGGFEYLALPSITIVAGDPVVELDIPYALEGWLQMIALVAPAPAPGVPTHLWLSYAFAETAP